MISPVAKPRLTDRRCLALVVLVALSAPAALADGVVVKSAIADYPVGALIATGEVLRLGAGQTVTILDRSGAVVQRTAGAYAGPSAKEAKGVVEVATALAQGPTGKSAVGGTRPGQEVECSLSSSAATDACKARGIIGKTLRVASYTPARANAAGQLVLESNFDGYAICVGWNPSEDSRFIPGGDPAHPVELSASAPVRLSASLAGGSMKSVSCAGVSPDVWASLAPSALQTLDPNSAAIVLSSFSKLRGDTMAEGRATAADKP